MVQTIHGYLWSVDGRHVKFYGRLWYASTGRNLLGQRVTATGLRNLRALTVFCSSLRVDLFSCLDRLPADCVTGVFASHIQGRPPTAKRRFGGF